MNKNKTWIYVIAIALTVGIAYLAYDSLSGQLSQGDRLTTEGITNGSENENGETQPDDTDRTKLPAFELTDSSGSLINISDLFGKPIVLNFWASWCTPCISEMPDFQKVYDELGDDIQFAMVNVTDGQRETKKKADDFISKNKYTFPVYYDLGLDASLSLGIYSYPTTIFIDKDGYVVTGATGALDEDLLRTGIDMID